MAKAVADGDMPAYRRLDTEYHRHILARANNRFLTLAHQQLEMKIQALRASVTLEGTHGRRFAGRASEYREAAARQRKDQGDEPAGRAYPRRLTRLPDHSA
jgi:DNA-binding GntR family transcriptional regulator